jgi:hypothetical protein
MPRRHRFRLAVSLLLTHLLYLPLAASTQDRGNLQEKFARPGGAGNFTDETFPMPMAPAARGWIWGLGPSLSFDTISSPIPGSGKYAAGPAMMIVRQPGDWTYGAMATQSWSFGGPDDRPSTGSLQFQPLASYRLSPRHTIGYAGTITADWDRRGGQRWTVPLGLSWSALSRAGDAMPIHTSVGIGYNVLRTERTGTWFLRFQINFIMPTR